MDRRFDSGRTCYVPCAVIGPVTARAIEKAGLKVSIIPEEATIEAMVQGIVEWSSKKTE